MKSQTHMLRVHFRSRTTEMKNCNITVHIVSNDIAPMVTVEVTNHSIIIESEGECHPYMMNKNASDSRLCILRLTALDWYLNVTMNLNFAGQSAPRCHAFAASVFDEGQTMRFFEFNNDKRLYDFGKAEIVKFEGDEIPLTNHKNPVFLRHELCQSRSIRYVSTTNTVLLVVYLDSSAVSWSDVNLHLFVTKTKCQAFTQFPLSHNFKKQLVENNTYSEVPLFRIGDVDTDIYHYAALALTKPHADIYGIAIYLRNSQVTYYKGKIGSEFSVIVRKNIQYCFIYQYIHDIYYNNWLNNLSYYISLTIVDSHNIHTKFTSSVIPVYLSRTHTWLDNRSKEFRYPVWTLVQNAFQYLKNNIKHNRHWYGLRIYQKQFFIELTCPTQFQQCLDIAGWYNVSSRVILWHDVSFVNLTMIRKCYTFGSIVTNMCDTADPAYGVYMKPILAHNLECEMFSVTPISNIHYWFVTPLYNRVILISYVNSCMSIPYTDKVTVTRLFPIPTTLTWQGLPNIEIGHSGNPLIAAPTIINIHRTMSPFEKYKHINSIQIDISSPPSLSMASKWILRNNSYTIIKSSGKLSWKEAEHSCRSQNLDIYDTLADAEEKIIVWLLLERRIMTIPIAIFTGPTLSTVSSLPH